MTTNLPTVSIMRANRLATDTERARAWNALMSFTSNGPDVDARAVQHAADVLCDAVTYRLRREAEATTLTIDNLMLYGTGEPFSLNDGESIEWIRDNGDGTAVVRVRFASGGSDVFDVSLRIRA